MFIFVIAKPAFDTSVCSAMNLVYQSDFQDSENIRIYNKDNHNPVSDSFFQIDNAEVYLFEGVLVNSKRLVTKYALTDCTNLIKTAFKQDTLSMLREFHGQFCGIYYNKKTKQIRVFTNLINSLRVYFYHDGDLLIAGTSLKMINQLLAANQIKTTVDEIGARMILTYGFMLSDYTTIKEIKHLQAGHYVEYSNNRLSVNVYHVFNNNTLHQSLSVALPELQKLFCDSVSDSFDKDITFNKKHMAFLSGGLDSRQTVMTAYNLGYKNISCLNFCEPGYADEIISRQIAKDLGFEYFFYSLEAGRYFLHLDNNLIYNDGQVTMHGAAHLYAGISSLNLQQYGVLHSGQIGDAILGSFLSTSAQIKPNLKSGAYSNSLLNTLYNDIAYLMNSYPNNEMFLMYSRAFNGAVNGDHACALSNYSVSPFLEPEFAQYCLNIDPKLRFHNHCYREWMLKYNRKGASYIWEKTSSNLLVPEWYARIKNLSLHAMNKIWKQVMHQPERRTMIPYDYWWNQNPELAAHYKNAPDNKQAVQQLVSKELWNDTITLFKSTIATEKILAYTVIAGLEYLYDFRKVD